jgi:hypothetical protein
MLATGTCHHKAPHQSLHQQQIGCNAHYPAAAAAVQGQDLLQAVLQAHKQQQQQQQQAEVQRRTVGLGQSRVLENGVQRLLLI